MRLSIFILTGLMGLTFAALAAPASAGTLTVGSTGPGPGFAYGFTFTGAAGETNNVVVTRVNDFDIKITDTVPITLVTAECSASSSTEVHCNPLNPYDSVEVINLEDGNDTLVFDAGACCGYTIAARVDGGPGNDTITGGFYGDVLSGGDGIDLIYGRGGDDTLNGDAGADTLNGDAGNDALNGGGEADTLSGGADDDLLNGGTGSGSDTLNGDAGNDRLMNSEDNDTFNGGSGTDSVDYTGWEFNAFDPFCEPAPCQAVEHGVVVTLDGVANDGSWFWDDPGHLTPLDNVGTDVEAVIGTRFGDSLSGGTGIFDQAFTGAAGNDSIIGGPGADTVVEFGDVNFVLTNTTLTGRGTDTLTTIEKATLSGGDSANTLDASAFSGPAALFGDIAQPGAGACTSCFTPGDTLIGGSDNDTLNGDAPGYRLIVGTTTQNFVGPQGHDTLVGGPGNDILNGDSARLRDGLEPGIGNDTLTGGDGNDALNGGHGTDRVVEALDGAHPTLTLTPTTMSGLGADTVNLIDQATLTGDGGNNTLNASAFTGPVTLDGGDGVDLLQGGTVADVLTGGAGSDTIDGGGGNDRLVETREANFTLTDGSLTTAPSFGTDTLLSIELATLTGGAGSNTLSAGGFSGAATLSGAAGNDTLTGGTNADLLNGGLDSDTVSGGGGTDTLNGDSGDDTLDGGAAVDALNGGDGDDTLDGGDAVDALNGGIGNDALNGGADAVDDTLDGGGGTDRVVESNDTNFTLQNASLIGNGNDALTNVEQAELTGGPGPNVLNASAFTGGSVVLDGAGGDDNLLGGSGNDTLTGGSGLDAFDAGGGDDSVQTRDGINEPSIACGAGTLDSAVVDGGDTVNADCESVDSTDIVSPGLPAGLAQTDSSATIASISWTASADNVLVTGYDVFLDGVKAATVIGLAHTFTGLHCGQTGTAGVEAFDAAGNHSARASLAISTAACAAPPPDTTAPNTLLTRGPSLRTKARTATFGFRSTEAGSRFQCKLDRGAFKRCASPKTFRKLKPGRHTFRVRAIDAAGNVDPTPAKRTWRIR